MPYTPSMPEDEAERIRAWHETSYRASIEEAGADGQTFDYLGRTFFVPPEVQPITRMSHLLGEAVLAEVRPDDRVLDMGTGSGVNAILAASAAQRVLAVDVNPVAVAAARANAERNGAAVEVRESDVFSAVDPEADGPFDLIVFDPPFRWFAPRTLLEAASTDEDYRALRAFFRDIDRYLAPDGRLLLAFGTSGDLAYLNRLVAEAGFTAEVVARDTLTRDGIEIEYVTLRATPSD